jgi:hypothetical protein
MLSESSYNSDMAHQYKRKPLPVAKANRLVNACDTHEARLVWTLLDTGPRVWELASLTRKDIDWQSTPRQLVIRRKGGPYGKRSVIGTRGYASFADLPLLAAIEPALPGLAFSYLQPINSTSASWRSSMVGTAVDRDLIPRPSGRLGTAVPSSSAT